MLPSKDVFLLGLALLVGLFLGLFAAPIDVPWAATSFGLGGLAVLPSIVVRLVGKASARFETGTFSFAVFFVSALLLSSLVVSFASFDSALRVAASALVVFVLVSVCDRAEAISGDGLAAIVVGVLSAGFVHAAQFYQHTLALKGVQDIDIFAIFGGCLAVATVILLTVGLLADRFHPGGEPTAHSFEQSVCFPTPTSGILPLVVAFAVLNGVSVLFEGSGESATALSMASVTTSTAWIGLRFGIILVTFLMFTALFNPARAMLDAWRRAAPVAGFSGDVEHHLNRTRRRAMWISIGYLFLLAGIYEWAGELPAALGVVAVAFAASVAFDIFREIEFRKTHGFYVTVARPARLWEVAHLRGVLKAHGIPVFVRGRGLRTMLRLLGFWSDLDVMVPGENFEHAQDLLKRLEP